ncbi:MAG: beta-galactosidase trimerization domain-containing protein [Clostridiales bacterium]|jgi:hypothetical protein|nr:beta-galactosidase trimerization domain-containing protein [Clostridiales bacterium]
MGVWWQGRPLRIFHPNARSFEVKDMDVKRFASDCAKTNCEAVVLNVGGFLAFYPSEIRYHHVNPILSGRDLIGEIIKEAHEIGIKILARYDFGNFRQDVFDDHPEWAMRSEDGSAVRVGEYYKACLLSGYINDGFGYQVMRESFTKYDLDGVHVNGNGFDNICYCETCRRGYGKPLPNSHGISGEKWHDYLEWRNDAFALVYKKYFDLLREFNSEAFIMKEMAGEEHSDWCQSSGQDFNKIKNSFSQLLCTSGSVPTEKETRFWQGITCDRIRGVGQIPIINVKSQIFDPMHFSLSMMPADEALLCSFQAIAHGAGLKLVPFGIPQFMSDPRIMPVINDTFAFMKRRQDVLDSTEFIEDMALVYPDKVILESHAVGSSIGKAVRLEFLGLYNALKAAHIPFGVISDSSLQACKLSKYKVVALTTGAYIGDEDAAQINEYVSQGGAVIVFEGAAPAQGCGFPDLLAEAVGIIASNKFRVIDYLAAADDAPGFNNNLPVKERARIVKARDNAEIVYYASAKAETIVVEDLPDKAQGTEPAVVVSKFGKGTGVYVATMIGERIIRIGHPDLSSMIRTLIFEKIGLQRRIVTNAPSLVDITLGRCSEGYVVHFVNCVAPSPLDAPIRLAPLSVKVKVSEEVRNVTVHRLYTDEKAEFELRDGHVDICLRDLESYAQIVIHTPKP